MITYRYDAYGNTTKSNNTLNNPYQYNAEYTDSSTGLQYLRARYYDSSQGRFTTKDTYLGTIPNPLSRNLYTYVENNPLNYIDPSGHVPMPNPMRNFPHISPMDQAKIDKRIMEQSKNSLNSLDANIYPGGPQAYYDKIVEDAYGDYFYGPSYSRPNSPYRYDPVKNPFGEHKNPEKRKKAQTALQEEIARVKKENYKKYCENGVSKATDSGKKTTAKINDYLAGLLASLTSNIADPTGILTELIYNTLGVDISGDSYLADFESAYNAGKITGDIISTFVSMYEIVQGITEIGGSITLATGGTLATATGVGAPAGVPAIAVSVGGIVVGVAEVGTGLATMRSSLQNLYDDVQNYNSSKNNHMIGQNGTQVTSKTTWNKSKGSTERIDVENPAPGKRPGQIHYHDANDNKYYYDIDNNTFYNQKTGDLAPSSVQKLLNDKSFMQGIDKAKKVLGE